MLIIYLLGVVNSFYSGMVIHVWFPDLADDPGRGATAASTAAGTAAAGAAQ